MRCLYEVLEVSQESEDAEIKKNYRRLALKWHPDKNSHQAEDARERFQEIQNAWEVLSDPQERAWYNSHRAQILRSDSHQTGSTSHDIQAENPYEDIDLAAYTNRTCFRGYGTTSDAFYSVYTALFQALAAREQEAYRRQKPLNKGLKQPPEAPELGNCSTEESEVREFYKFWCNFQTVQDFAWLDEHNPAAAPGRRIRRLMETENERRRKAGKLEFVSSVRAVADCTRMYDERMERFQKEAAERKKERQAVEEARREEEKAAKRAAAAAYQDADWIRAGEEEQLAALDIQVEEARSSEGFECVVCDKMYKSAKALENHEASKKHQQALRKFKKAMRKEDQLDFRDLQL